VIEIYAAQGFERFLLCTGYLGEQIERFAESAEAPGGVTLEVLDTGLETPTGGRIRLVQERIGAQTFCVTYADGVADIDLEALVGFHRRHGELATVSVVRPRLQWGVARLDGEDRVAGFVEKPRSEHWINGGFFCFEPGVFDYLTEDSVLERAPLEQLAAEGRLRAYRHQGFWDCMDTYKDAVVLNQLWNAGEAAWRTRA
jgi:glucose-1-phosphate cytidylyltransferase